MALSTFYRQAAPGGAAAFATTHWSVVLTAGESDREKAREALGLLCAAYWYPLYVFARRQGCDAAESEDLTQEFLAQLLQRNDFAEVSPERGRFRSFLMASFKHLLTNAYHRQRTEKRGGRVTFVSLENEAPETRYRLEPAEPRAGQPVTLTLQWAAAGPLLADYTVFVQLIDSAGSILAQGDGPPRGGRYPSTVWAAGDVFSDEHQLDLPANLPSGYYVMLVGLYNREDNQRLLTGSNDHVSLPITLREP